MPQAAHIQPAGVRPRHIRSNLARCFRPPLPWAGLTFVLVAAVGWPKTPPLIADSIAYRAMALGRFGEVPGSICGRILHPAVVRFISWATKLNIDQAFFAVALVTLAVLIVTVAWILKQTTGFGVFVLPLLFTPVLVEEMFGLYYCQDLFYAALLCCFFVALLKGRKSLALSLLFPLFLTRESTVLLAAVWAVLAWCESDLPLVGGCIGVTLAGWGVSRVFAALGQPNIHHTNELVFLVLKPAYDSLRNLLGVVIVPEEMRGRPGFTCTAAAIIHLPWHLYGFTRQFGICAPDLREPLHTFTLWLSLFGIGPAVVWKFLRRRPRIFAGGTVWLRLAALYGLLAFFAAPFVSEWLERDIGYAWPLFWFATPALFKQMWPAVTQGLVAMLLLENAAACWMPFALGLSEHRHYLFLAGGLCTAVAMQATALRTLTGLRLQIYPDVPDIPNGL